MSDRYASFAHTGAGRMLVKRLGLPDPPRLRRYQPGDPLVPGPVALGAAPGGRLAEPVGTMLDTAGVEHHNPASDTSATAESTRYSGLIFDATGITDSAGLRALYDFFHPLARTLHPAGRVIVLGTPPELTGGPREATAQRAVEGLIRSIGKEFGRGTTAQLVYVAPGGEREIESTLRFLLSGRSAYVSGQVIRIGQSVGATPSPGVGPTGGHRPTQPAPIDSDGPAQSGTVDWDRPLTGKVALVTGAARGIGAAVAEVLARDGAQVVALDVPGAGDTLAGVANAVAGTAVQLDLTAPDAPTRLADHFAQRHGRVDIVVHNAGITRDKTLGRMDPARWDSVMAINLSCQERINDVLLERELIPSGGRLIGVSSIAGIAGNRGQANYATSKAGVIGLVQAMAPLLANRGITVNAVAPGFIETRLTARIPIMLREAGRRMNSMAQGGLPVDVAETIAWFASPGSSGVTGNIVRVCGQSLLGA